MPRPAVAWLLAWPPPQIENATSQASQDKIHLLNAIVSIRLEAKAAPLECSWAYAVRAAANLLLERYEGPRLHTPRG